jgi:hypothetical protein
MVDVRRARIAPITAGVSPTVPVVWRVSVVAAEIRAGRENADQQEIGSIEPEWIVVIVRPKREGEDVTKDERPEDRAGPEAPAVPSLSGEETVKRLHLACAPKLFVHLRRSPSTMATADETCKWLVRAVM